jgi:putative ABC transport system permease protein
MLFKDAFRTATRSLTHRKMRSALTMLGIVIGIASVITIMSLGDSAQAYILGQVQSFGSDIISVNPGAPTSGPPAAVQGIVITTLNQRDIDSLGNEPSIVRVAARVSGQATISYGSTDRSVVWHAFSPIGFDIFNMKLSSGSVFTEADARAYNKVVILGSKVAKDLFGSVEPVGKYVRLKDTNFRVVGVFASKGAGIFSFDDYAVMPLPVGQKQMLGIDYYHELNAQFDPRYDSEFVKGRIASILRQNHRITDPSKDDFMITSMEEALDIIKSITTALTLFLSAIATISLIVGGIGIMNIMLVSVTERTREIGLRKAVGATESDIMQQFLIESVLLTMLGGLIGVTLGAALVGLIYVAVTSFSTIEWVFAFPLSAVVLALSVSTASGLVFGIYPARQAAKKNPIDALRYE